jgi:hypothetical protein
MEISFVMKTKYGILGQVFLVPYSQYKEHDILREYIIAKRISHT